MSKRIDRHVRRSGADYVQAFLRLLPQGNAWPRQPDTTLVKTCTGLNEYRGFVDGRAADLFEIESDPRRRSSCCRTGSATSACPTPAMRRRRP